MCETDFWQVVAPGLVKGDFSWLEPLRGVVSRLIVFGCWDDGGTNRQCREPYVLLRVLQATYAVVVDKEAEYISNAQSWYEETRAQCPDLFAAWNVQFVVSDMTRETDDLPVDRFDLAYCSGVLYFMRSDMSKLQASVNTMARVVRPGGWVIANEDEGLDSQFEAAGLAQAERLDNAPEYAYCYRKPLSSRTG